MRPRTLTSVAGVSICVGLNSVSGLRFRFVRQAGAASRISDARRPRVLLGHPPAFSLMLRSMVLSSSPRPQPRRLMGAHLTGLLLGAFAWLSLPSTGMATTIPDSPKSSPSAAPELSTPAWHDPKARRWSGFSQADYVNRQSSLDELSAADRRPLNENRFVLRNARLRYQRAWKHRWMHLALRTELELLLAPGVVRPTNVELRLHSGDLLGPKARIELSAGLIAIPFGFEMHAQGHGDRFFGERSMVTRAFLPGRFDLGLALWGHYKALSVVVALQNGEPIGVGNFAYLDPNKSKDITARAQLAQDVFPWLHLQGGVSWLWGKGFSPGSAPTKDRFEWLDIDGNGIVAKSELLPIPGAAGRASESFERWAVGADFRAYTTILWKQRTSFLAEGAFGQNMDRAIAIADPVLLGRDQRSFGYYVGLTQEIGPWVEVGTRYEHYEPNADRLELFDGINVIARRKFRAVNLGAALRYRFNRSTKARLLVEYEFQDNALGRTSTGRPAKLNNNTFRTRVEVVF